MSIATHTHPLRPRHSRAKDTLSAAEHDALVRVTETYSIQTFATHATVSDMSIRRALRGDALTLSITRLIRLGLATLPSQTGTHARAQSAA